MKAEQKGPVDTEKERRQKTEVVPGWVPKEGEGVTLRTSTTGALAP